MTSGETLVRNLRLYDVFDVTRFTLWMEKSTGKCKTFHILLEVVKTYVNVRFRIFTDPSSTLREYFTNGNPCPPCGKDHREAGKCRVTFLDVLRTPDSYFRRKTEKKHREVDT